MTDINTGVGRIVWGNPLKAQQKRDNQTKQPLFKDGKPVMVHSFGLAIPKAEFSPIWQVMAQEAATIFPQGVPAKFSWKMTDGDGIDAAGKPYSTREGYAGCYILAVSQQTGFPPQVVVWENNQYRQLGPDEIKAGDFVVCGLQFKANAPTDRTHTPGLYCNPTMIMRVGFGQAIISGPDATQIFGAQPQQYQLPPGASAQPLMPNTGGVMPGGMPGAPQGYPMPGAPQQPAPVPYQPGPAPMPGYPQPGAPAPQGYPMPGQMPPR